MPVPALPTNIRPGWKSFSRSNALAYFGSSLVTLKKSFITYPPIFFVFTPIFVIFRNDNIVGNAKKQFFEAISVERVIKFFNGYLKNNQVLPLQDEQPQV
jgi:hypothetical protein